MKTRLFCNARIYSLEREGECFGAMLVRGGRIVQLFGEARPRLADPRAVAQIDLGGRAVIPGMTDSHCHFLMSVATGVMGEAVSVISAQGMLPCDLSGVRDKMIAYGRTKGPRPPLLFHNYIVPSIAEKRLPEKAEIDAWLPGRIVIVLSMDGHSSAYSSAALQAIGLADPDGNGILKGQAHEFHMGKVNTFLQSKLSLGLILKGTLQLANDAAAHGLTGLHCLEGFDDDPKDLSLWFMTHIAAALPLRLRTYSQYPDTAKVQPYARYLRGKRIGGCLAWEMDGAVSSHTAAFLEDYRDEPGNQGACYYTVDEARRMVERAHVAGYQVTAHALGTRGIETLLSAYEQVFARHGEEGNRLRHRIDHFEFPAPDQVGRALAHRLLMTVQPGFAWVDDTYQRAYRQFLSDSVYALQVPLKTIAAAGGMLLGSSDSPVQHLNPFLQMQGMVSFPLASERLSVYEALRTYTYNGAYATFEEDQRGTLRPGKRADFAVLEKDPFAIDPQAIHTIKVIQTYIDGRPYKALKNPLVLLLKGLLGWRDKV